MKKTLIIILIVLASIVLILFIVPFAFKGKINDIIRKQANEMLNAKFDFKDLNLSLFRNFPNASVSLYDVVLSGIDEFDADTLIRAGRLTAAVDLLSLFSDHYQVTKVEVQDTYCHAIILEEGKVNWDVMKPAADTVAVATDTVSTPFAIELKKVLLDNVNVIFEDRGEKLYTRADDIHVTLSGNFSAERTRLAVKAAIAALTVKMSNIAYLSNAKVDAKLNIDAELAANKFTFLDNRISLNAITASLDGWFAMPDSGGFDMDLKVVTDKINFKDILSMIPAVYAKDFKGVQASGEVALDAWARGLFKGDTLPAFNAKLDVANASFHYPSLPRSVQEINISATAANPGGAADLTVVDVPKFSFNFAGNPFALTLRLATPVSDPDFAFTAKGALDLGLVKEVYPVEDMTLSGVLNADVNMAGRLSYVDKGQFDKFKAAGTLGITGLGLNMKDMPPVEIQRSQLTFSPSDLKLSQTMVTIGQSDITTDCTLENYLGFALKNTTLKGNLNVNSNYLNFNELMGEPSTATTSEESAPMTSFVVPKNIDFNMNTSIKKLTFDKIEATNVTGNVAVSNGTVNLKNLSLNALDGGVVANGSYSTARDEKAPDLSMTFKLDSVSFAKTFAVFPTVAKFAPIFADLKGKFSGSIALKTTLDGEMTPVISSLSSNGFIATKGVDLSSIAIIGKIVEAAKIPQLSNLAVKDMRLDYTLTDGRLATKPFDIKLGGTSINLSGSTGIDQTIDYLGKITIPPSMGVVSKVGALPLRITGTFTKPSISVDMKAMAEAAITNVVSGALGNAASKLTGVDLTDVTKQREALVDAAQKAGAKLVEEAKQQSQALVDKAGNPLAKVAAQAAGDKLVKEAQKKSDAMVAKAVEEGNKLIDNTTGKVGE